MKVGLSVVNIIRHVIFHIERYTRTNEENQNVHFLLPQRFASMIEIKVTRVQQSETFRLLCWGAGFGKLEKLIQLSVVATEQADQPIKINKVFCFLRSFDESPFNRIVSEVRPDLERNSRFNGRMS